MEQLCIRSFLHHGHEFHFFVYDPPESVPPGTILLDASRMFHRDRVFTYREHNTVAGFSNFFRHTMLLENGGWWVDMDTVCVAPFEFTRAYVISSEGVGGDLHINSGILKTPAGSDLMSRALRECEQMDTQRIEWGQCGPMLMDRLVREFALQHYVVAPDVFCPVHWSEWRKLLDPSVELDLSGSQPARFTCGTSSGGGKGRTKIGRMPRTANTNNSSGNT
jgi:hypothetical protein